MNATNITNNSAESSRAPRRALRVIVVEDEKDSLSTLVGLLQSEGHEVRGVGSAKALWSTMPNFEPDICLIDIGLPDRSGYDIAGNGAAVRRCTSEARRSDRVDPELGPDPCEDRRFPSARGQALRPHRAARAGLGYRRTYSSAMMPCLSANFTRAGRLASLSFSMVRSR